MPESYEFLAAMWVNKVGVNVFSKHLGEKQEVAAMRNCYLSPYISS